MKKIALALLLALLAAPLFAAEKATVNVGVADLESALRAIPSGDSLTLEGVTLGLGSLELKRFEAFTPDAKIVIHGEAGDTVLGPPDNRYFQGHIIGDLGSRVVLSVTSNGVRGMASSGGKYWMLGRGEAAKAPEAGMTVVEVDAAAAGQGFACEASKLPSPQEFAASARPTVQTTAFPEGSGATYGAKIGVETDQEFLALFGGSTSAATDYVGDLIAHGSTIYADEVDTAMAVSHLSLWTSTDPWAQFSTICGLIEFGRYWNDNNDAVDRTIGHFMSGKNNGGGVAWVGVLCFDDFTVSISGDLGTTCPGLTPDTDNYGGAYGYSGQMTGGFDIDNPSSVWDIVVTTHEMGHNFNSPHSHCYGNLGGNASPVDECYAGQCGGTGCHCGGTSLPGCSAGGGCGTIMSYCHLLSGGLGNVSLTFGNPGGTPFAFGVEPERIPERMNDHVVATAIGSPLCLAPVTEIFADGFESGDTDAWQ